MLNESSIQVYSLVEEDIVVKNDYTALDKEHLTWIRIESPQTRTIKEISQQFNIDIEDIQDFLEYDERGRVEVGPYIQIVYNTPQKSEDDEIEEIAIFAARNLVITVQKERIQPISRIIDKLQSNRLHELFKEGVEGFLYYFMNEINHTFDRRIEIFRDKTKTISPSELISGRMLKELYQQNIVLIHYNQALIANAEVMKVLRKVKHKEFSERSQELFDDLYNDCLLLIDRIKIQGESIINIFNAQSILSNQETNITIQRLTILTVILMVPTLIAGLYGMNLPLPDQEDPRIFWIIVVGTTLMLALIPFVFFMRRRNK